MQSVLLQVQNKFFYKYLKIDCHAVKCLHEGSNLDPGCINKWDIIKKGIKLSVYNLYVMVSIVKRQSLHFKYEIITQVISFFFKEVLKYRCNWLLFSDCNCNCNQVLLQTCIGNCFQIHFYGLMQ